MLLWAVGQPIFTDELWWHLALGHAFLEGGPWLATDPLLFAPAGPPAAASWLADVAFASVERAVGFGALRALHVAFVAAILALAWFELRRASRSRAVASLGTLAFAALSAYRLVQLRPDVFSIGACLLVYRWLLADGAPPPWRRVAFTTALAALWANVHPGFPIGLVLIGTALAGLVVVAPLRAPEQRRTDWTRAQRLAAALCLAGAATSANPAGVGAHLAYFTAGATTPSLALVMDEWAPVHLFALPVGAGPPSPLSWALVWATMLGVALVLVRAARGRRALGLDPAIVAVSLLAIGLSLSAVRLLWLGVFPLLLFARALDARERHAPRAERRREAALAAAATALAIGFHALGDWPAISRGASATGYAKPYHAEKYYSHAIWLLHDSGLRGNLYNEYFLGGFAGYWLAPGVRSMVNGTLNFPSEIFDDWVAIGRRRGQRTGEDFPALLDRLGIDLFLGVGMPDARLPGRHRRYAIATTTHLESTPGWIPIFRNLDCAIYLRANERNRENLDRLERYYGGQRVPFDRERGFEVDAVLRDAPDWAIHHGLVPDGFARAAHIAITGGAAAGHVGEKVAALYAVLGRYERAVGIDRSLLLADPKAVRIRRRLVWSLLSLGRAEEAAAAAAALEEQPESDGLSHQLARVAREALGRDAAEIRASMVDLPFLYRPEAGWLLVGIVAPQPRPPRVVPHSTENRILRASE